MSFHKYSIAAGTSATGTPALKSGKPVFVDKTFADSYADAQAMFAIAETYHTPLYSTFALRYSAKIQAINTADIQSVAACGSVVTVRNYIIHLLGPLAVLMDTPCEWVEV